MESTGRRAEATGRPPTAVAALESFGVRRLSVNFQDRWRPTMGKNGVDLSTDRAGA
jgi:hypothetical protein